jgi:hypothetical protein
MSAVFRHYPLGFTQIYLDLLELWGMSLGLERTQLHEEARPNRLRSNREGNRVSLCP